MELIHRSLPETASIRRGSSTDTNVFAIKAAHRYKIRNFSWLKWQHAQNPDTVAGLTGLAVFIGMTFALANDGVESIARLVGRAVLLFGLPALVVWKLDPESVRHGWRNYNAAYSGKTRVRTRAQ